jgi:hypothetical protein
LRAALTYFSFKFFAFSMKLHIRQQVPDTPRKVSKISKSLKSNNVIFKKRSEKLSAPRELLKDIQGRKRNMLKKSESARSSGLVEQLPNKHQLIVVHPDIRVVLCNLTDGGGELTVDADIRPPILRGKIASRLQIMKKGPNDFIGEA